MIRAALLAMLFVISGGASAFAQTNCASDSLKASGDCFTKALAAADADMQSKYRESARLV